MKIVVFSLLISLFLGELSAFSTSNIQYLYGKFDDNSLFDTVNGGKSTVTAEHYRTFEYGDFFGFFDYAVADDRFFYGDNKTDLYFELSPRISLSKTTGNDLSFGFVKELYLALQYNRQIYKYDDYKAYLYGVGSDLSVKGFEVFSLNIYKVNKMYFDNSYQLSLNYLSDHMFDTPLVFEGFADWTKDEFLTQNQLLYDLGKMTGLGDAKAYIGTEWHYYRVKDSDTRSNTCQIMMKLRW
jgi:nucleoside-specific outer membrane channel protein Tsx